MVSCMDGLCARSAIAPKCARHAHGRLREFQNRPISPSFSLLPTTKAAGGTCSGGPPSKKDAEAFDYSNVFSKERDEKIQFTGEWRAGGGAGAERELSLSLLVSLPTTNTHHPPTTTQNTPL